MTPVIYIRRPKSCSTVLFNNLYLIGLIFITRLKSLFYLLTLLFVVFSLEKSIMHIKYDFIYINIMITCVTIEKFNSYSFFNISAQNYFYFKYIINKNKKTPIFKNTILLTLKVDC